MNACPPDTRFRHNHRLAVIFFLLWSMVLLFAADAQSITYENKLDRYLQDTMRAGAIPGMALAIVKDGEVSLAKGYGVTGDGQPFTADTPILIASLSKAMTAAVALMLVAEGRIDLDSSARRYLPEFRVESPDGGAAITLRHLLNQTSGLSDRGFPEMRIAQPATLAGRVSSLRSAVPEDIPGTAFHYFNSNYALAARIVEVVSGKAFEIVLEEELFKPLGMTATSAVPTFAMAQAQTPPPATGYVVAFGRAWRWHEPGGFLSGHGGVISTASDMARWLKWQMTGQPEILPLDLLALMQTPPAPSSYAMGWFRQETKGETTIWHDGIFSTVHSDIVIKPQQKLGIVLLYDVGGVLQAATTFPNIRAGALAVANSLPPEVSGLSLVTTGRLAGAVTLILAILALIDLAALHYWYQWARAAPKWRVAMGLAARLLPITLLLSLPQMLQFASGRAFSLEAVCFAMLDVTAGLALVGTILASSALLRLAILARRHAAAAV